MLVTGASRGIGRAVAEVFARAGDGIAIHYGQSVKRAEAVRAALPGDRHIVVQADLRDPDAVQVMVDAAAAGLDGLDVVVNNAGVFHAHPVLDTSYERWQLPEGSGSKAAGLAMAFKLLEAAQGRRRAVHAPHLVALVRNGAVCKKGKLVERSTARGLTGDGCKVKIPSTDTDHCTRAPPHVAQS